ncbi:MAG: glycosyltransferase [Candidatus Andersenbacteria bacterium]|nr:glycosyltransferase [Candidatus Andersenbacteria bacterium]
MATHNGSRFIEEALASVLRQTYQNIELLVVDDASSDGTGEIVRQIGGPKLRLKRNEARLGLTRSLNRGLALARGEFIARLDDDDVWVGRDKLVKQVGFLKQHPDVGLVGTQNMVVDERGREMYRWRVQNKDEAIRRDLLQRNQFVHSGVLVRREAMRQAGGYDERRRYAQDYELWLRIGTKWQLANLPDMWVKQRVNRRGVTSRHNLAQFGSFLATAFEYRQRYPSFWKNVPVYARELLVNLLPKMVFYKVGGWRRYFIS